MYRATRLQYDSLVDPTAHQVIGVRNLNMDSQQTDQLYALVDMGRYGLFDILSLAVHPEHSVVRNMMHHAHDAAMTDFWFQQRHSLLDIFLSRSN